MVSPAITVTDLCVTPPLPPHASVGCRPTRDAQLDVMHQSAEAMAAVTDLHVVFSNHLDLGFNVRAWCDGPDGCTSAGPTKTGLPCRPWAYWVLNENINVFLPRAAATVRFFSSFFLIFSFLFWVGGAVVGGPHSCRRRRRTSTSSCPGRRRLYASFFFFFLSFFLILGWGRGGGGASFMPPPPPAAAGALTKMFFWGVPSLFWGLLDA